MLTKIKSCIATFFFTILFFSCSNTGPTEDTQYLNPKADIKIESLSLPALSNWETKKYVFLTETVNGKAVEKLECIIFYDAGDFDTNLIQKKMGFTEFHGIYEYEENIGNVLGSFYFDDNTELKSYSINEYYGTGHIKTSSSYNSESVPTHKTVYVWGDGNMLLRANWFANPVTELYSWKEYKYGPKKMIIQETDLNNHTNYRNDTYYFQDSSGLIQMSAETYLKDTVKYFYDEYSRLIKKMSRDFIDKSDIIATFEYSDKWKKWTSTQSGAEYFFNDKGWRIKEINYSNGMIKNTKKYEYVTRKK